MTPQKHSTLIADPPWQGQSGEKHYETMSLDAIKSMGPAIREVTTPDGHCWIWVTNGTLPYGKEVLEAWGYEYRSTLSWIKPRLGLGPYLRNMTEHVMLGTRGKAPVKFRGQGTWLFAPIQDHSHKPEEFLEVCKRVSPGPYLEIFARRPHADFSVWGKEVRSDVDLPGWPVPDSPATRSETDVA